MTVAELIALYKELTGTHLSPYTDDSDYGVVHALNRAYSRIARYIRYFDPMITWTLTATTNGYTMSRTTIFSKAVIKPYEVFHDSQKLPLYTMREFLDRYKDYRWNSTPGTPTVAYWNVGKLWLHVPPDASAASKTTYVSGECYPSPLSASSLTDVPDLPLELHETICYYAAVLAAEPTASDDVALSKLKSYSTQALIDLNKARDMNEELILGSWEVGEEYIS